MNRRAFVERVPYVARITNAGLCRSCSAVIAWVVTRNGKPTPLEPCGAPHFALCPNTAHHRKGKGR